jgi:hypothetical protein
MGECSHNGKKKKQRRVWFRRTLHHDSQPTMNERTTVKASNFRPLGNFGPLFASSVASLDESCTKVEQNRIGRS